MDHLSKKRELCKIIQDQLQPLIDRDYVLYGLPYYNNVGDILIWNGELEFLKGVRGNCVGTCSWNEYPEKKLPEDIIILITGGGYFGDLWRPAWDSVLKELELNKKNKIILFPNTIYYTDQDLLKSDAIFLAEFENLTICVRDKTSYEIAKEHFKNTVLLIPDMAFCMNECQLQKFSRQHASKDALLFKRLDKESPSDELRIDEAAYDEHDWAPMESMSKNELNFWRILTRVRRIKKISPGLSKRLETWLFKKVYRRVLTQDGARQLSSYRRIYTTRLHAMILGCLLGRDVYVIDNRYGKLSSYYETWLTDCDNVIM